MPPIKLPPVFDASSKANVSELHRALSKLKLPVSDQEKNAKTIESSTADAIKSFQKESGLKVDGKLDEKTVSALNTAVHDKFVVSDKTRVSDLHALLQRVGLPVDKSDKGKRSAGDSTRKAIEEFQKKNGLPEDGKASEQVIGKLRDEALKQRLASSTQVAGIQKQLQRISKIAGLNIAISDAEIKGKQLGATSVNLIKAFQKKYRLPETGVIDRPTLHKIDSVGASKGTFVKTIGRPEADKLKPLSRPVRINKVSAEVNIAQTALSFLGYKISEKEFSTRSFGKTTRKAVLAFQKSKGLKESGHLERDDIKQLNKVIAEASPAASPGVRKYRIRGSVRDELWQRRPNTVVRVYEKLLDGESPKPLAAKRNFPNGFFDLSYDPPIDPKTGQVKRNFHVVVKFFEPVDNNPANDKLKASLNQYNVRPIHWANHTEGDTPFYGESRFTTTDKAVRKAIGNKKIEDLHETADEKQISQTALQTGLATDEIMRLVLSYLVAKAIGSADTVTAEVVYAFISQNFPTNLPGDLLRGTAEWQTIGQLTELTASGIVLSSDDVHDQLVDSALSQNLVTRRAKIEKDKILAALQKKRTDFTLEKPILIGNQNLGSLLSGSAIAPEHFPAVAESFLKTSGINSDFWNDLDTKAPVVGKAAIEDFASTVELGNITKNHLPTVKFLKDKIGADPRFTQPSSFAKLSESEIVALIGENGKKVPDNMPGGTADEKVANFGAAIKARADNIFPAASLIGEIKRKNTDKLAQVVKVEKFLDDNPDLNLKEQNVDRYLSEKNIDISDDIRADLKTVQRAQRIAPGPKAAATLIDAGLHSSMQIYFGGRDRLDSIFSANGISKQQAARVYESAKFQYFRVLARLVEFRHETNGGTPAAIIPQTYSVAEVKKIVGDIPNLELLFGSLDFCECEHCKSLYSPSAYLTDTLRFIGEHDSLIKKDASTFLSVKDILFKRRPDLGNIKLNCQNTDTPLPYIDLVCEILEAYVTPLQIDFAYQTTLSQKELRAVPQYVRQAAYEKLATSDFPISSSFNLFQEEARTYLNYLRIPRSELMERFQDISDPAAKVPNDIAIAAEYFGISSYERDLIITSRQNSADQDKYWGFDSTQTEVQVKTFTDRSKLDYYQLLDLLLVRFVNNPRLPNRSEITRPADTCDTAAQKVNNLSAARLDLMNRFIRLWRHTGWKMWELDLLVRNPMIGNNAIDGGLLANLKRFRMLQDRFKLPFEVLLSFYGDINREVRISPENPDLKIDPLYKALFQNIALTNPLDPNFTGVDNNDDPVALDASIALGENPGPPHNGYDPVPTILSTMAISQQDLDRLAERTDGHLSIASLSTLLRYSYLARGLKINVRDLLLLLKITNVADPFASVKATVDIADDLDRYIKRARLSLVELDYVLNFSPDSTAGLRNETLVLLIEALRKTMVSNNEAIEKLGLSEPDRDSVLAFDADALAGMMDANLLAALLPLQNILSPVSKNFSDAGFSVEESAYVVKFQQSSIDAAGKAKLVQSIKTIQGNLRSLFDRNRNQITSQIASAFSLTDSAANILLSGISIAPDPRKLTEVLGDQSLIARNADGTFQKEITPGDLPTFFDAYTLVHKASVLVNRMGIGDKNLEWFLANANPVKSLDFSELPVAAKAPPNDFEGWLNLVKFLDFGSNFPEPEDASLRSILDLAMDSANPKAKIFDEIAKLTQWTETDIAGLDAGFRLQHSPGHLDYTQADVYSRLKLCFDGFRLAGVGADGLLGWARVDGDLSHDKTVAVQTRQAVKSKYEQDDWLQKVTPLHDEIREKKRKALVEFHIENSQRSETETVVSVSDEIPNPLYWKDPTALYKYFLIDVEMSSCQLTSRIKQAISSVQLFVQRCFLNLENRYVRVTQDEKADTASANAWSQWKYMKNYRVWEANRKVFFYPENWLEPELRDDKSPFFMELENELLQGEVNQENVEAAFLSYLHKVDEVSHLDVCGLYHEMENLSGDETMFEINKVHVIARTKAIPHVYYYRCYDMNYSNWSAWERIDGEIQGDQVVPVVYNRKLYLFWLQFNEKPMKTKKVPPPKPETSDNPKDTPEPMTVMEIQLGWMTRKSSGWSSKKISKQKLIHPWGRPHHSYNLKPYYLAKFNELYLDIYISTSKEFNDGEFYDPYALPQNNPVKLTKNPFNETFLPWHSSSFVFDGHVTRIELKALQGSYHLEPDVNQLYATDSYNYVHNNFDPQGKMIDRLAPIEFGPRLRLPSGMHFESTRLANNKVHLVNTNQLRVLEGGTSPALLDGAISPFELVITQQDLQLNTLTTDRPVFYQDHKRAFFIKPEWEAVLNNYGQVISHNRKYRFTPFYHPYTMLFIREFNRDGIDGLLNRTIQTAPQSFSPANNFSFSSYSPASPAIVDKTAANDIVDFSDAGAYSIYNWELFFHAPLMIACRLMQNQKFEDAMNWFHYIFNPTNVDDLPTPQRYWITKPFFEYNSDDYRKQRIETILSDINKGDVSEIGKMIEWKNNPFKPHLIARNRPVAYQRNVVFKYLDNLIAWGDMLFGRDTIESINEASLLYMLAYEILGDRPQKVPNVKHEDMTFNEIEPHLDEFGNARLDVVIEDTLFPMTVVPSPDGSEPVPKIENFYFCIPNNDFVTKYWDTVEDRLFKIRNCQNIQGIFRQLPLFEPPIDPALLVKAAAAGIDLGSVLNDVAAPTPHYRFRIVVQKAIEYCSEVKQLGEKLLSVLERKDAEELATLRSQHELAVFEATREVREKQVDEIVETIGNLNKALELADAKKTYYDGREFMNLAETAAGLLTSGAIDLGEMGAIFQAIGAVLHAIPMFSVGIAGFGGSPNVSMSIGGGMYGSAFQALAGEASQFSTCLSLQSSLSSATANYTRRQDDWTFQSQLAAIEKDQIQFQINAAEIRQAIAEKELENQELQIENAKAIDDHLRNKFTSQQLYSWMVTQAAATYFQSYQLAFELAKKAEKCFQYELGIMDSNYIQFGYWDSLKKGLFSADKLGSDLRRLEAAYLENHRREYEITKHVSLAQMFPLALLTLKRTGKCTIGLPEWLFDMDYPGHYMRRIKNVSISVPCIVGPYTGVNCTLSLVKNETRVDPTGSYDRDENDDRFRTMFGSISSIATSSAQIDSGVFELSFSDERYLPFEGAGAISEWQIEMPLDSNYFDFGSLADVMLHVSYTSRSGGGQLAAGARTNLQTVLPNSAGRLFSLKHEFATEWYKFLNPEGDGDQELVITIRPEHFPFFVRGKLNSVKTKKLDLFFVTDQQDDLTVNLKVTNKDPMNGLTASPEANFGNTHHLPTPAALTADMPNTLGAIRLKIRLSSLNNFKSLGSDTIKDAYLLIGTGT